MLPYLNTGEELTRCLRCSQESTHVCIGNVPLVCYCAEHAKQHQAYCPHVASGRARVERIRGR